MYNSWYDVFPEIVMISDKELQKKVVETYDEALKTGGWQLNDIDTIPFTLLIPDTVISYRTHVRTVTRMSMKAYEEWEVYGEKFLLNKDYLSASVHTPAPRMICQIFRSSSKQHVYQALYQQKPA